MAEGKKLFFCYRINNKIWVSNMEVAVESVGGWLEELHKEQRLSLREQSDRRMTI